MLGWTYASFNLLLLIVFAIVARSLIRILNQVEGLGHALAELKE